MDETFGNASSNPSAGEPMSGSFGGGMADKRSSVASSVERVVETGATKAHGAIDASKTALQSGVRKADDAIASASEKAGTALDGLQQKAGDAMDRVARNPQVEEATRNLEQQIKEHPIRTLAVALGLGILVGRSFK